MTETEEYFRLRAEWLRYKNQVFDSNSELPTLAAVLDDVRRLMEERSTLGLVYFDLGGEGQIEALHGWQAYDEVLRAFARALVSLRGLSRPAAGLRGERLLGPRDIVAVMSVRSDKFLVFLRGTEAPRPDSSSMEVRAHRLRAHLQETLGRMLPPLPAAPFTFHMGHAVMYRDPMLRAERSIHRALDQAMFMSLRQRARDEDRIARDLDAVIAAERVDAVYQPILDLVSLDVLGHEVFTRGPAGGPFEDPERLFLMAERTGRLVLLERLCRRRALESVRRHLPTSAKLFLNTSARALRDAEVAGPGFVRLVDAQGLRHDDVVLEIRERVTAEDGQGLREVLRELKAEGFGIAIDDMGAGHATLKSVVDLEPDYLKFDISLVHNIDRSLIKRSLLETLVELSGKIGAQVIAEGIEAESEFNTVRDMGVRLGQGRYLGAPMAVPSAGEGG